MDSTIHSDSVWMEPRKKYGTISAGLVLLFVVLDGVTNCLLAWDRLGFACWVLPMAIAVVLLRSSVPQPMSRLQILAGCGILAITLFLSWSLGRLEFVAIALGASVLGLAWMRDRTNGWRNALTLLCLTLLPFAIALPLWDQMTWLTYRSSAWQTSALLDGLEIPNLRIENSIQVRRGELDVVDISHSWWGMEFTLAWTVTFLALFRRGLLPSLCVLVLAWSSWVCWQSLRWTLWAYQVDAMQIDPSTIEAVHQPLAWLTEWVGVPTLLTLACVPLIDGWILRVLMPIPEPALAMEFPLPAQLYNATVTFPYLPNVEDWTWRERFDVWRERLGIGS